MRIFARLVSVCVVSVAILLLEFQLGISQDSDLVKPAKYESIWKRVEGADWPRMLGEHFDSHSSEVGLVKQWPSRGPRLVWSRHTGTGYGNGVTSNGRWFFFDRAKNRERLTCCEAETGLLLWTCESPVEYEDGYGYNNGPRCSPVVDGDRVYVLGVTGTLACVSAMTGEAIWRNATNDTYSVVPNFFGVGASPLVYDDLLIVMIGGSKAFAKPFGKPNVNDLQDATPNGCGMIAFYKLTGVEKYRVGNYHASYSAPMIAKLGGKDHCLALMREGLMVFDPVNGKEEAFYAWRANMVESVNASTPVVFEDHILISEAYEKGASLLKWDAGKLSLVWKDEPARALQKIRCHWSTPIMSKNLLFASSGRNQPDTDFRCLLLDGDKPPAVQWAVRNRNRGTGLVTDEVLIWLGEQGDLSLVALNSKKLEKIADCDLNERLDPVDKQPLINPPSWAPPVLSHGYLYLRGEDRVVCFDLVDP